MKEAPFYIGQKVVCVTNLFDEIKKGSEHIVLDMMQCGRCKHWYLNIGVPEPTGKANAECCGVVYQKVDICEFLWFDSKGFSRIDKNEYKDVTKELAKLPQDEVPDVKKVKELVN